MTGELPERPVTSTSLSSRRGEGQTTSFHYEMMFVDERAVIFPSRVSKIKLSGDEFDVVDEAAFENESDDIDSHLFYFSTLLRSVDAQVKTSGHPDQ